MIAVTGVVIPGGGTIDDIAGGFIPSILSSLVASEYLRYGRLRCKRNNTIQVKCHYIRKAENCITSFAIFFADLPSEIQQGRVAAENSLLFAAYQKNLPRSPFHPQDFESNS